LKPLYLFVFIALSQKNSFALLLETL